MSLDDFASLREYPGMLVDQSIARVRAFAAAKKWSRNKLATEAGVAESTIRSFGEPGWSPNAETLRRLEAIIPPDFEVPAEPAEPPASSHDEAA